ncbi:MAG TPA: hypothetical protein VGO45_12200 [Bacteroidia bacterium]|nr:hypothetical protein [Bacteroidia bacterium]
MNPLIAYSETSELKDARSILYLMLFLFSASVILRALHFFRFRTGNGRAFRNKIKLGDGWLLISAVLLILLFLLPDSDFHAGFMSIRLCFLFYLSLLVWIGHQEYPKLLIIPVVFLSLVVLKSQFKVKFGCLSELNSIAIECHETSKLIKANTVIMPLNYTENWMLTHFSNYLGHEKPMVILDNYEACTGYFPLLFIPAAADRLLSYGESRNCISCPWDLALLPDRVDYIFALGKGDHLKQRCSPETDQKIAAFYTLIYKGDWVNLYALKRAAILSYTSPEANLLRMQLSKFNFLNLTTVNP